MQRRILDRSVGLSRGDPGARSAEVSRSRNPKFSVKFVAAASSNVYSIFERAVSPKNANARIRTGRTEFARINSIQLRSRWLKACPSSLIIKANRRYTKVCTDSRYSLLSFFFFFKLLDVKLDEYGTGRDFRWKRVYSSNSGEGCYRVAHLEGRRKRVILNVAPVHRGQSTR